MEESDRSPRDITTDHETIREWVENRGGTPAHVTGETDDTARTLYIVEEGEAMDGLESISWEAFFETFEDEALAFVYQDRDVGETDEWLYDLVDREEVAERAALETTDVEEALLEGEVVRSELTETKVIETTVVETDRIESEVVDSEIIERTVRDREPVGRELVGIEFVDAPAELPASLSTAQQDVTQRLGSEIDEVDRSDRSVIETGTETGTESETEQTEAEVGTETTPGTEADEPIAEPVDETTAEPATDRQRAVEPTPGLGVGNGVVLDVHETVLTTTEIYDRKTVESRVVDQEITEDDTVESDAIDIEGVERTLLESDVIEGELVTDETGEAAGLPSGAITSERTEGETIRSQFVERRLVETESTDHHRLTCDITDYELVDIVEGGSTITERAIVDREADEVAMLHQPETGVRTTDEQLTAAEESAIAPAADAELAAEPEGEAGEPGDTGATGEAGDRGTAEPTEEPSGAKAAITDDEIGKRVVSGDEELGLVSDVDTESQTLYVEPEPSLADRIKAAFDWGDTDDAYPVTVDQIESVDNDEVRVSKQ